MPDKRKRSSSHRSANTNPHSYSADTLKQLRIAGLAPTAKLPSATIKLFPHRPLPSAWTAESPRYDPDADGVLRSIEGGEDDLPTTDDEVSKPTTKGVRWKDNEDSEGGENNEWGGLKLRKKTLREPWLHPTHQVLRAVIDRSLQTGHITRAKKSWALLLRSDIGGTPVDLRMANLWSMGAEILMRDGEDIHGNDNDEDDGGSVDGDDKIQENNANETNCNFTLFLTEDDDGRQTKRWGRAENLPKVKAYYESLSEQYPYEGARWTNVHLPNSLDFEESKFACEIYSAQVEHKLAIAKVGGQKSRHSPNNASDDGTNIEMQDAHNRDDNNGDYSSPRGPGYGFVDNFGSGAGNESNEGNRRHSGWTVINDDDDFHAYQDQWSQAQNDNDSPSSSPPSGAQPDPEHFHEAEDEIRTRTLEIVRDIATRLDHQMIFHPFSSSHVMLRQRAMVSLWIADLLVPSRVRHHDSGESLEERLRRMAVERPPGRGNGYEYGDGWGSQGRWDGSSDGGMALDAVLQQRKEEIKKTADCFRTIVKTKGVVEGIYERFAEMPEDDEEEGGAKDMGQKMYSAALGDGGGDWGGDADGEEIDGDMRRVGEIDQEMQYY